MTPQHQTAFGKKEGNCFAACIASILDVPLETLPVLCTDAGGTWWEKARKWIEENSHYSYVEMSLTPGGDYSLFGQAYWIGSGKSPRGDFDHAVVYCGTKMVHDPHPDGTGLLGDPHTAGMFVLAKR